MLGILLESNKVHEVNLGFSPIKAVVLNMKVMRMAVLFFKHDLNF